MKRVLRIAACAVVALIVAGWWARPRVVTILTERQAARTERHAAQKREVNHLPDDALRALASDPGLTLFSIDPERGPAGSPTLPTFQRWIVLGQTTVAAAEQRQLLADTLQQGLRRWSGREIVGCFNPRHAIRATDGEQTFEFLICFECGRLYYYPPNSERRSFQIRIEAGPFDDILAAASIPLSKPPPSP